MNKFMIAAALMAVLLATTGAAFAEYIGHIGSLTWSCEPTAGFNLPGLYSTTYRLGNVQALSDIMVVKSPGSLTKANVSQSTKFEVLWDEETETEYESPVPTPWLISMPTAHKAADTHFLFAMPGVIVPGSVFSETNDRSNPAGIASSAGYYAGLGTFSSVGGFAFASPLPDRTLFMQVVTPASGWEGVVSFVTPINGIDHRVWLVTPEPGTVAMFVAGAACLVVVGWCKRRG